MRRAHEIRTKDMFPYHFVDLFVKRVLPVSALSWLVSITAIAFADGGVAGFLPELVLSHEVYLYSLIITGWVSIPPLIWMSLVGSRDFEEFAVQSYWGAVGLMVLSQLIYMLLFPEDYGRVRLGTIISVPLHFIIFILLMWPMAPWVRKPIKGAAALSIIYGVLVLLGYLPP